MVLAGALIVGGVALALTARRVAPRGC